MLSKVSNFKLLIYIDINLKNPNFYHYKFSDTKDYVGYGIKVEKFRTYLVIRSPFVINNKTSKAFRMKFLSPDG